MAVCFTQNAMHNDVFVSDVEDIGIKCTLSKFAVTTNLGGVVDSLKGRETLERDLNRLCSRMITRHMKFNKEKCWILQLEWDNTYRLGDKKLKRSPAERYLGIWVNGKLSMSQQCPGSQAGQPPVSWDASGRGKDSSHSALSATVWEGQGTTALFSLERRRQWARGAAE